MPIIGHGGIHGHETSIVSELLESEKSGIPKVKIQEKKQTGLFKSSLFCKLSTPENETCRHMVRVLWLFVVVS
jgi:hypothetical protein